MDRIKQLTDGIVKRLKACEGLGDVRFVREYGARNAETPVTGWLAAVCVTGAKLTQRYMGDFISSDKKGAKCTADVELRLYAPQSESGGGLTAKTSALLNALKEADHGRMIGAVSASAIRFDAEIGSVYRSVCFTLTFYPTEEAGYGA